jgi:peroxiredoxin
MAITGPICEFGLPAPDFRLKGTNGLLYSLADIRGDTGTLIMFICNHCPYVQAIADRLVRDAQELQGLGIGVAAIMSNDTAQYPEDSFENMALFAAKHGFTFPYLIDETQEVAEAYDAVCTPDFFGYDARLGLQYRGRLDSSGRQPAPPGAPRELFQAMSQVALTGKGPSQQTPSQGCSIKWRNS